MNRDDFRKHLASLGRKGGKARLTKMSPLQRQEVARHAAEQRWKRTKISSPGFPANAHSYPLLVRNPPHKIRLVCDGLGKNGFRVAPKAWLHGDFAHLECKCLKPMEDPRDSIKRILWKEAGVLIKTSDIEMHSFGRKFVVPIRLSSTGSRANFVPSKDFRSIEYEGVRYRLGTRAAAVIKFLYQSYCEGQRWCSADIIRAAIGVSESHRLDHLFRTQDGPRAWRDLIHFDKATKQYRILAVDRF